MRSRHSGSASRLSTASNTWPTSSKVGAKEVGRSDQPAQSRSCVGSFRSRCIGDRYTGHRGGNSAAQQGSCHLSEISAPACRWPGSHRLASCLATGPARGSVRAAWCPLKTINLEETLRSVSEASRNAAAEDAAVTPGTTSKAHSSLAQGVDLLGGAAENHGVSGLKPDHGQPSAAPTQSSSHGLPPG